MVKKDQLYAIALMKRVKSAYEPSGPTAGAYPAFLSMDGMLVDRRVTSQN